MDDEVDLEDEIDDRCTVLWDENNDRWRILLLVERTINFLAGISETFCVSLGNF